jgi:hypothetical protein
MSTFFDTFLGPLNKSSCFYFLIMTIIFFVILVLLLGSEVIYIFTTLYHGKKFDYRIFTKGFLIIFNIFIAYFVNRLFYTMCSRSLV